MRSLRFAALCLFACVALPACPEPAPVELDTADAVLMRQFPGYPGDLVAEVLDVRTADGRPVFVAVDAFGAPLFVGTGTETLVDEWTPTVDYVLATGGSCSFR
jgi:hypothetical protein